MSVKFPIAVPVTDAKSSRPVETDNVPAPSDDGPTDDEFPVGVVGPAGVEVPRDCKATGVVVTPSGEPDGTAPGAAAPLAALLPLLPLLPLPPLRPDEPPCAGPRFRLPTGAQPQVLHAALP